MQVTTCMHPKSPGRRHPPARQLLISAAARVFARDGLDGATTHVVLTPRGRLAPLAHWQVLDWGQFAPAELDRRSPLRRAFRLPDDVARRASNWLEIVGFCFGNRCKGSASLGQIRIGLRQSAAVSKRATDLVGIVTPQETSFVLAAVQFALLQKARGDALLLRAGAAHDLIAATQHHDWRPHGDVGGGGPPGRRRIRPIDPVLRAVAALGIRFGAAGLSAEPAPRPCILGRLSLAH